MTSAPSDFPAPAPVPAPALAQAPVRLSILLAEDNDLSAQYAELLLGRWGHRVLIAANGVEALALHARHRFDLILMDLDMPEMGGLEATAAIRAREAGNAATDQPATPVIALTAYVDEADRQACLAGGMDGFLSKPLDTGAVERMLAHIADRRNAR
jgi:two-component system sensor histidine kinase/response regulator